jgi:hypothetical protein
MIETTWSLGQRPRLCLALLVELSKVLKRLTRIQRLALDRAGTEGIEQRNESG